jgi:uncharacterized BrkB/YihY/UPF0761 family membrane protein
MRSLSWIAGVWALAWMELLVAVFFVRIGPSASRILPIVTPEYIEILVDLVRTTALVNLMVILGLWVWVRNGERRRSRRQHVAGVGTALALVLVTLAMGSLIQDAQRQTLVVDGKWLPGEEWTVHEFFGYFTLARETGD